MRWSLRLRLTASFVVVTLIAVAAIALEVLPTLESSMVQQRLRTLVSQTRSAVDDATSQTALANRSAAAERSNGNGTRRDAIRAASRRQATAERRLVDTVARQTGAAVVLLVRNDDGRLGLRAGTAGDTVAGPESQLAALALARGNPAFEAGRRGGAALRARIAVPLPTATTGAAGQVVVVSASLSDVRSTVALVRRRVLLGGALGVLVAFVAGGVVALGVSMRLRRLELGSREVAAGRFTTRFNVDAQDELGSLARSLDTMQRQLAELDGSRKRFIATASHELRTPLQSLSGYVELLRDEELDEETRRSFFDQLESQISRLTRLSGDLLDLSRLESGGVDLRLESTDLHALAERVAREFGPTVERERRSLDVRLIGPRVVRSCDPDRVEQLLRVLVDNALKHSGADGAVQISVGRSHGAAEIAVSDDGPGVSPDDLNHIFEPFHGTGDGSGAGLGLAIAREIAHRMRGTLEVSSVPGRTTFTLRLPG